jgi:hypothetical protein
MVTSATNSILLIGESGVGKTHYGAQLLQRLMKGDGLLSMKGSATNLEPFEAALQNLNEGRVADHTPTPTYLESIWPIADRAGREAKLVWPDYGGEQIKAMIASRRVPKVWQDRVRTAQAWLFLIRLQQTRAGDDILSRPLAELHGSSVENRAVQISDQARLIELLQMLIFVGSTKERPLLRPQLAVLLSCWDELGFDGTPLAALQARLPMLAAFIESNWQVPIVLGLSALGRPLSSQEYDREYVLLGPEEFGYVVQADGSRSSDLTAPVVKLLDCFL